MCLLLGCSCHGVAPMHSAYQLPTPLKTYYVSYRSAEEQQM